MRVLDGSIRLAYAAENWWLIATRETGRDTALIACPVVPQWAIVNEDDCELDQRSIAEYFGLELVKTTRQTRACLACIEKSREIDKLRGARPSAPLTAGKQPQPKR